MKAIIEKLSGDGHADRVEPLIHGPRVAASIPKKPRQGVMATRFQVAAEDIARSLLIVCHSAGTTIGLLAADLITPQ